MRGRSCGDSTDVTSSFRDKSPLQSASFRSFYFEYTMLAIVRSLLVSTILRVDIFSWNATMSRQIAAGFHAMTVDISVRVSTSTPSSLCRRFHIPAIGSLPVFHLDYFLAVDDY